jgi:hypothetical protein
MTTMTTNPEPTPTPQPNVVAVAKGDTPLPIRLTAGTDLHIHSGPSPQQPWSALESSDPAVLACHNIGHPDGSVTATCHAVTPGTATLTTVTAPFKGDPRGPAQHRWQLSVTVQAA